MEKYGQSRNKKKHSYGGHFGMVVRKSKTTILTFYRSFYGNGGHTGSNINRDVRINPLLTIADEHIIIFMSRAEDFQFYLIFV